MLNRCLWLLHRAAKENASALLVLDESCAADGDDTLRALDAKGNWLRLPGTPALGCSAAERAALFAAALDRMPGTAEAGPALERLLPPAGMPWLDAAVALWSQLLGGSGGKSDRRDNGGRSGGGGGSSSGTAGGGGGLRVVRAGDFQARPEDRALDLTTMPTVVWMGPRHFQALAELGLEAGDALAGEDALLHKVKQRDGSRTHLAGAALAADFERGLAQLRQAILSEGPGLLGSWARLRRTGKRALRDHQHAAERFHRNRRGIRGSRVHALAQAVRPGGGVQSECLGLVCAAALFRLDLDRLVEHCQLFHGAGPQDTVIVNAESGICLCQSLS